MAEKNTPTKRPERVRRAIRLHADTAAQVSYWSVRESMTDNEYMAEAVEEKIARQNQDYDLPTLEQQRLNQLVDEVRSLAVQQANTQRVIYNGFDSLIGLARGESYLVDQQAYDQAAKQDGSAADAGDGER